VEGRPPPLSRPQRDPTHPTILYSPALASSTRARPPPPRPKPPTGARLPRRPPRRACARLPMPRCCTSRGRGCGRASGRFLNGGWGRAERRAPKTAALRCTPIRAPRRPPLPHPPSTGHARLRRPPRPWRRLAAAAGRRRRRARARRRRAEGVFRAPERRWTVIYPLHRVAGGAGQRWAAEGRGRRGKRNRSGIARRRRPGHRRPPRPPPAPRALGHPSGVFGGGDRSRG
jgi:hypothetical protein